MDVLIERNLFTLP